MHKRHRLLPAVLGAALLRAFRPLARQRQDGRLGRCVSGLAGAALVKVPLGHELARAL